MRRVGSTKARRPPRTRARGCRAGPPRRQAPSRSVARCYRADEGAVKRTGTTRTTGGPQRRRGERLCGDRTKGVAAPARQQRTASAGIQPGAASGQAETPEKRSAGRAGGGQGCGTSVGSPRCARIWRMTRGSSMVAITRMRPPDPVLSALAELLPPHASHWRGEKPKCVTER